MFQENNSQEIIKKLQEIQKSYGILPVRVLTEYTNDKLATIDIDGILVEDITNLDGIMLRKNYDYDKWTENFIDNDEEYYRMILKTIDTNLLKVADNVWSYNTDYEGWETDRVSVENALEEYYNNYLKWTPTVTIEL